MRFMKESCVGRCAVGGVVTIDRLIARGEE